MPLKTAEQQAVLSPASGARPAGAAADHADQRGARAHGGFGIIAPQGAQRVGEPVAVLLGEDEAGVARPGPSGAASSLAGEVTGLGTASSRRLEAMILAWHKAERCEPPACRYSRRRPDHCQVPIVATVGDAASVPLGTALRGLIGLVPKQNSSGGKTAPGRHFQAGQSLSAPAVGGLAPRR